MRKMKNGLLIAMIVVTMSMLTACGDNNNIGETDNNTTMSS